MKISERMRRACGDGGFTLIEMVITVAIVGIIVGALTGMVMQYLKTTINTEARFSESHDIQFVSAYWQRDVASIGVRSTTYDNSHGVHRYPLLQSVNVVPSCPLVSPTPVVTLAWSEYDVADPDHPRTITVTYSSQAAGTRFTLVRRRCSGATVTSTITVADNLTAVPTVTCDVTCTGAGASVPTVVNLALSANDPTGHNANYTATLSGERRET